MVAGIGEVGGTCDVPAVVGDQVEDCVGGVDHFTAGIGSMLSVRAA